jgi:chromosomal replication initiator protein
VNSAGEVWRGVLEILEKDLTPTAIKTWFGNCQVVDLKDKLLVVHTPSEFTRDIIVSRYAGSIKSALREIFSTDFDILVISEAELASYLDKSRSAPANPFDGSQFTFDKFVVGASNRFAYAAAVAVSQSPAAKYNPLFIYGDSGLGKTHLLYSIGHAMKNNFPGFCIVYVKGDDFINELVNAIGNKTNTEFREKYRMADLLLVDDIQFIAGKEQTQEEFFHTFNALYESGKQIVLTSDRPPKEMLRLEDRLKSRFEWGLLADIQPPDYETRVAIIKNKAQRLGVPLPDRACNYIAENVKENIRQIEGIVRKIQAYRELETGGNIEMEQIEKITREVIRNEKVYTPDYIIEKIALYYGISVEEISGKSKIKNTALARQISMYLLRKLTNLTLEDIGSLLNKDHSTVLHAIRRIEDSMSSSPELADVIRDITANIANK